MNVKYDKAVSGFKEEFMLHIIHLLSIIESSFADLFRVTLRSHTAIKITSLMFSMIEI